MRNTVYLCRKREDDWLEEECELLRILSFEFPETVILSPALALCFMESEADEEELADCRTALMDACSEVWLVGEEDDELCAELDYARAYRIPVRRIEA